MTFNIKLQGYIFFKDPLLEYRVNKLTTVIKLGTSLTSGHKKRNMIFTSKTKLAKHLTVITKWGQSDEFCI